VREVIVISADWVHFIWLVTYRSCNIRDFSPAGKFVRDVFINPASWSAETSFWGNLGAAYRVNPWNKPRASEFIEERLTWA
jgi:hypothetical protein